VIRSFRDRETEKVWAGRRSRACPPNVEDRARNKLRLLHTISDLSELRDPPGNRLEQLKGDRAGQWSVRINDQWRICFVWNNGNADDVEITDYH